MNSYKLKQDLKIKAQKAAITQYIKKLNAAAPEKFIQEITQEYSLFIDDIETLDETWESLGSDAGQLAGEYKVSLHTDKINLWLKEKGFSHSANLRLVIMEEPPSLGQMKLDKAFGNDVNGQKFFLQNYTVFQRRLRDAIIKKADKFGFDVKLLADDELYSKYKSKDQNLVGVYFDVNSNAFAIDQEFLDTLKANDPDTLVLYYRIDALVYDASTKKIRATIGFTLKNLASNVTKVFGTPQTFEMAVKSQNPEAIIDDMAFCVQCAINLLMNGESAGSQLNSIAMSIRNSDTDIRGPLKLVVNASAFESKIRKKAMYTLKKEILVKKIANAADIRSSNTSLIITISNPEIKELDVLYMEHISPILEKIGIELSDDKVHYSGNTLVIQP